MPSPSAQLIVQLQHVPGGRDLIQALYELRMSRFEALLLTDPNNVGMVGQAQGYINCLTELLSLLQDFEVEEN